MKDYREIALYHTNDIINQRLAYTLLILFLLFTSDISANDTMSLQSQRIDMTTQSIQWLPTNTNKIEFDMNEVFKEMITSKIDSFIEYFHISELFDKV
jgi:hypothetical protein